MQYLIFLLAFIIRVIVQYSMGSFVHPETWEYEVAVNNFLAGRGFVYDIYGTTYYSLLTPLYPALCITVYFFTNHSFLALALVQAFISSFTCLVVFWIGRRIFGRGPGLLAAFLTAMHPGFIIYASKLHAFVLDSFLICLIAWLLIKARHESRLLNQIKLGVAFGLGILTRATVLLLLPFAWLWLKKGLKQKFLVFVFTAAILVLPWAARNYFIYHKVIIASSAANVFWRGNNPLATGTSLAASGKPMLEEARYMNDMIYGKSEMEQSRIFWNESLRFIRDNPLAFVSLTARKLFYFWWFAPTTGSEYKKEWLAVYRLLYILALLFACFGLRSLKNMPKVIKYDILILVLLMLIIAFAQGLYYVETRHRWAIEPLILIFTAQGILNLIGAGKRWLKMNL